MFSNENNKNISEIIISSPECGFNITVVSWGFEINYINNQKAYTVFVLIRAPGAGNWNTGRPYFESFSFIVQILITFQKMVKYTAMPNYLQCINFLYWLNYFLSPSDALLMEKKQCSKLYYCQIKIYCLNCEILKRALQLVNCPLYSMFLWNRSQLRQF